MLLIGQIFIWSEKSRDCRSPWSGTLRTLFRALTLRLCAHWTGVRVFPFPEVNRERFDWTSWCMRMQILLDPPSPPRLRAARRGSGTGLVPSQIFSTNHLVQCSLNNNKSYHSLKLPPTMGLCSSWNATRFVDGPGSLESIHLSLYYWSISQLKQKFYHCPSKLSVDIPFLQ